MEGTKLKEPVVIVGAGLSGLPAKMRQKLGEEHTLSLVIDQLTRLFGPSAEKPL
jgi:monoamine oxidase